MHNILPTLVSILTGPDASLQYLAARVFCHISAGTHDHAESVLKSAGSYIITYLDSSNSKLQVGVLVFFINCKIITFLLVIYVYRKKIISFNEFQRHGFTQERTHMRCGLT